MTYVHITREDYHVLSEREVGVRWCFYCRKRVTFTHTVYVPDDPMSYYGAYAALSCEKGHADGDCFPGTWREWGDS